MMRTTNPIALFLTLLIFTLLPASSMAEGDDVCVDADTTTLVTDTSGADGRGRWWREYSDYTTEFRPKQLIAPVTLFAVGAAGLFDNSPMRSVNLAVRDQMTAWRGECYLHFDDYVQYAPVALYPGLAAIPPQYTRAKHTFAERVCVAAVAYISVTALTNTLKYTIRELRPDASARNSFTSGHTATAFAGAELVRSEYGWGYGLAAYALASTVGFMRMYNNRHWLGDVLGGAAVGIISARIGYWLLPLSRRIFGLRSSTTLIASPMYMPENRGVGMSFAMSF